jgi:hypothetical protein
MNSGVPGMVTHPWKDFPRRYTRSGGCRVVYPLGRTGGYISAKNEENDLK